MPRETGRPLPRQTRSRERVEAVRTAALEVLRSEGLAGCTMAAVAARAGITPTSLYRYFPNVEAVLQVVAERQLDETHALIAQALTGLTSLEHARQTLVGLVGAYESIVRDDPARRALWSGGVTIEALNDLNIADSRRNGYLIAERISPFLARPLDRERAFLVTHLVCLGTVLLIQVDDAEAAVLRPPLQALVLTLLD